jgi:two-component system, NtrC family, sensor histidine kinase HydH
MIDREKRIQSDLYRKIKWLIFFRALFAAVLLGSSMLAAYHEGISFFSIPLFYLNIIAIATLLLSGFYALLLPRVKSLLVLGYLQLNIDIITVSVIILLTGGFSSVFSFLYLLVIIYASMVTFRRGGMIIATICVIQYGVLVDLEYYGIIRPFGFEPQYMLSTYSWEYVIYKMLITIAACFAVAFLSGYLSEQEKRAKLDLWAAEEQIKRVEKLAAIGEMASGLAHEIKNPLAAVSGSIQVLKEELPYEPYRDKLMDIVIRETERISALLNDFLLFAKPGTGRARALDVGEAADEIVTYFESDLRHRHRKIVINRQIGRGTYIHADPEHIRQVLWNLLLNADEAIDGPGSIHVAVVPMDRKNIGLTVTDSGCGMTTETMQSIFDPFFTQKTKGTGLGLSIVQRIVTACNGIIDVSSMPGKGSSFILKFPQVTPFHKASA